MEDSELVGLEITAFDRRREGADVATRVVEPLLSDPRGAHVDG